MIEDTVKRIKRFGKLVAAIENNQKARDELEAFQEEETKRARRQAFLYAARKVGKLKGFHYGHEVAELIRSLK